MLQAHLSFRVLEPKVGARDLGNRRLLFSFYLSPLFATVVICGCFPYIVPCHLKFAL
jgi:hypothetical protein